MPEQRIAGPGFYTIDEAAYHADPAPTPSLSSGIVSKLITGTAADAQYAHPRLTSADPEDDDDNTDFDLGSVAHELVLGRGSGIHVIDAKDWRTKAAKEQRAEAIEQGLQPCLLKTYRRAEGMADAARHQLADDPENFEAFVKGEPEVGAFWIEQTTSGPIWCRSLIDWKMPNNRVIYDYKTFKPGADPEHFVEYLCREARDIQDPFYSRGVAMIEGCNWDEVTFRFVVQSPDPPYLLSVVELASHQGGREWSYDRTQWAIDRWARCLKTGQFPGFVPRTYHVGIPTWAMMRWDERFLSMRNADDMLKEAAE